MERGLHGSRENNQRLYSEQPNTHQRDSQKHQSDHEHCRNEIPNLYDDLQPIPSSPVHHRPQLATCTLVTRLQAISLLRLSIAIILAQLFSRVNGFLQVKSKNFAHLLFDNNKSMIYNWHTDGFFLLNIFLTLYRQALHGSPCSSCLSLS